MPTCAYFVVDFFIASDTIQQQKQTCFIPTGNKKEKQTNEPTPAAQHLHHKQFPLSCTLTHSGTDHKEPSWNLENTQKHFYY